MHPDARTQPQPRHRPPPRPSGAPASPGATATAPRQAPSPAEEARLRRDDEDRRAVEQWLRRVPDDPGGLLRRKFEYESGERALRERREGSDDDGTAVQQPW
jgi:Ca-activated chloride channel family protein